MAHGLFATKPIGDLAKEGSANELNRVLDARALVLLGIGAIIGTGIFVLTGTAAANHAGPALVISFIIAGVGCAFAGLCYAEFAAMIPVSGSAYSYSYTTLGEFIAWFVGWNLILEYLFAAATIAVGWSGYVVSLLAQFGLELPPALTNAPFAKGQGHWELVSTGAIINLPAVLILAVMSTLCYVGIQQSARFNGIVVAIKVIVIVLFIGFGAWYVQGANWDPFIPPATGPGQFGWGGVVTAAGIIFFAYIGFDSVSTHAEEAKNPRRDVPIGIIASLVVCTVLYIAVVAVLTGMVPYGSIDKGAGVSSAFSVASERPDISPLMKSILSASGTIISIAGVAGITSVLLVMMLSGPRVFLAMARDGLVPTAFFAEVHPVFKTPWKSTIAIGVFVMILAGVLPIDALLELTNIGTLFAFAVVCSAVMIMRRTNPLAERPFKCPFVPVVPLLGIAFCLLLMLSLPVGNWLRLIVWLALGLVIYFLYGRHHSTLGKELKGISAGPHA